MDFKDIIRKSQEYDALVDSLRNSQVEVFKSEEDQKHLKGYLFDSLVYRFKDYQARAFQVEVNDYRFTHSCSESEAREKVRSRHNRDLMRFIAILDEAIGEHD